MRACDSILFEIPILTIEIIATVPLSYNFIRTCMDMLGTMKKILIILLRVAWITFSRNVEHSWGH